MMFTRTDNRTTYELLLDRVTEDINTIMEEAIETGEWEGVAAKLERLHVFPSAIRSLVLDSQITDPNNTRKSTCHTLTGQLSIAAGRVTVAIIDAQEYAHNQINEGR